MARRPKETEDIKESYNISSQLLDRLDGNHQNRRLELGVKLAVAKSGQLSRPESTSRDLSVLMSSLWMSFFFREVAF